MGIRGLTTFIAKSANQYLINYELHDTYLVIDGNNLASQLYKWHCTRNDCFGGDYDKYEKTIVDFFDLLEKCNVTPLIIFDGGYESRKIRTVFSRLQNKLQVIKKLNSVTQSSNCVFPLHLRDVFVEIVLKLSLRCARCDFEGDYEIACLARSLNCPVLSYDSDFYVFDVLYIPFSTVSMNLHKSTNGFYISCRLYQIENFLRTYGGLSKENLPLMAALLGNDYIGRTMFNNFYSNIKLPKRKNMESDQQRRIKGVIKWMQEETYDSAIKKILGRIKKKRRRFVACKIKVITRGYICQNSILLKYLNIENDKVTPDSNFNFDTEKILEEIESEGNNSQSESDSEDSDGSISDEEDVGGMEEEDVQEIELEEEEEREVELEEKQEVKLKEVGNKRIDAPEWFKENFRKCAYPSLFMDILTRNAYFCTPQPEDYFNKCSHLLSTDIIVAIYKILKPGMDRPLKYFARGKQSKLYCYKTPACNLDLPTLSEVPDVDFSTRKRVVLEVLGLNLDMVDFLNDMPSSWQLYILSIIFWIKKAEPRATYSHVYSLILCMLMLNRVGPQIGYYRATAKFMTKFKEKLNSIKTEGKSEKSIVDNRPFTELLSSINEDDCLLCYKELIVYFQMEPKMSCYQKLYDVQIVDCFAQFQSCLLHVKYLNLLLNRPFETCIISEFYDGTFVYNMCTNLAKRTNVDVYVDLLLKDSPNILTCFKIVVNKLSKIMTGNITVVVVKRRRRKRKNNTVIDLNLDSIDEHDSEGEIPLMDENNRFSLLNIAK